MIIYPRFKFQSLNTEGVRSLYQHKQTPDFFKLVSDIQNIGPSFVQFSAISFSSLFWKFSININFRFWITHIYRHWFTDFNSFISSERTKRHPIFKNVFVFYSDICSHILGVEITLFYCWIPFKGTNPRLKAFDSQSIKIPLVSVMVSGPICTFQNFDIT